MPVHRPEIIAHRGASGHRVENSLAAFYRALELGADGVELDVHSTSDGALVVHHDATLPGVGRIADLTADTVRGFRLPNGEPVPYLTEALEVIGDHNVWIELKTLDPRFDGALLRVLDHAPAADRYAVHAFDHRIVARLGSSRPNLRRGILLSSYLLDPVTPLTSAGAGTLWQEQHLIDGPLVEKVHAAGCTIVAWTVNAPSDIARLCRLRVDGLCGNYPDRLREAVGA
ncbi:MAG TPA: glycerophosphodiester phosphodiesterase [Gemmatimonadales bacterium]|nr:glycerophosphodiester phosphodiesterase [Gemmatimonadales bacterium]